MSTLEENCYHRVRSLPALITVAVTTSLLMFFYEITKQMLLPQITLWQSHVVTVVFSGIVAALGAYLAFRRINHLNLRMVAELTKREEIERALRESEELYRLTLTTIPGTAFITDDEGYFTFICPNIGRLFGHSVEEVQAMQHVSNLEGVPSIDLGRLNDEGMLTDVSCPITDKEGNRRFLLANVKRVAIKGGTLLYTFHDVTSSKEAELARQEDLHFLSVFLESVPIPIFFKDLEGRYQGCNERFAQYLGSTKDEIIGKTVFDVSPPETAEEYHRMDKALFRNPGEQVYEASVISAEGVRQDAAFHKATFSRADGTIAGLVGAIFDLTERKAVERALQQSEAIYRSIVETIPDGLTIIEEGKVKFVSDRACEIFGYPRELYVQMNGVDFAVPEEKVRIRQVMRRSVERGRPPEELAFWIVRQDGTRRYICNRYALIEADGQGQKRLVVTMDSTERKWIEDALRASERRHRFVSELTSDIAYALAVGPEGKLTTEWVTGAVQRITGFTAEAIDAQGGWLEWLYPANGDKTRRCLNVLLSGRADAHEVQIRAKDGTPRWLYVRGQPVWGDAEGRVVRIIGAAQDITERKQMEQRMVYTERLAAMGNITATLAHEIKNPLQAIQSNLELALDFPLEPDEREESLHICWREVEHLLEITQRVLSLVRTEREHYRPVDLRALLDRTVELLRPSLNKAGVTVTMELIEDLPPVLGDFDQISQVLLNLLLNAIEAMTSGGQIHVRSQGEGGRLTISLMNDGPAIPEQHLDEIFEPFMTTKPNGVGLGLFISHHIVEQHGGTLRAENLPDGAGVVFKLSLPVAEPLSGEVTR